MNTEFMKKNAEESLKKFIKPTFRVAQRRHAAHHLSVVNTADTLYKRGDVHVEEALRVFNINEPTSKLA
jgi:hypothetical protein